MPKLYISEISPPVRSVLLLEKALELNLQRHVLDPQKQDNLKPEFIKINPQHTVPTLVDDDGTVLWDSHVIMSYLVGKYAKTDDLYPNNLKKRAVIDQRMYFETEKGFGGIHKIIGPMKENKTDKPTNEGIELANSIYSFLNIFIGDNNYVAGNSLTIADFSLITSIQVMNLLVPVDNKYENVHKWFKVMEALPYYDIVAEGVEKARNFLQILFKPE